MVMKISVAYCRCRICYSMEKADLVKHHGDWVRLRLSEKPALMVLYSIDPGPPYLIPTAEEPIDLPMHLYYESALTDEQIATLEPYDEGVLDSKIDLLPQPVKIMRPEPKE
jgi:hypothetical protein